MADEQKTDPGAAHDKASHEAREAEEARQRDIVKAVDKTNREDLPKIGGPLKNPGLGR